MQTERVVNKKDNTYGCDRGPIMANRPGRFRNTLAGSTVTIHEHLDDTVSIRYGPHVVGRYDQKGEVD